MPLPTETVNYLDIEAGRRAKGCSERKLTGWLTSTPVNRAALFVVFGCLLSLGLALAPTVDSAYKSMVLVSIPEYERQLRRVVVSLARRDTTLELQHEMLAALPEYSRIILLLPKANEDQIKGDLVNRSYGKRVELVTYLATSLLNSKVWMIFPEKDKLVEVEIGADDTETYNGSIWAQDLFEVMTNESGRTLLVQPFIQKWFSSAGRSIAVPNGEVTPDNLFSTSLAKIGFETLTVPVSFFGGNLLVDERADVQRIAFCGADMLATTRTIRSAIGVRDTTDEQIKNDIKEAMKVDQVIVFGAGNVQPYLMFHLDQTMLLLSGGIVAVPRLVGALPSDASQASDVQDVERLLVEVRSQMEALDYRVVDIETSVANLLECQHYVNAIAYTDVESQQNCILMPMFGSKQTELDQELILRNTRMLESLGYSVRHVPTSAQAFRGGIHCLVNVID